jgi:thiamine-monophosphate kinase
MVSCQSDVAAMGFMPRYSTITLGLRGNETCDLIDRIYVGMAKACSQFGGRVVGGDVVRSETMFISVAMVGSGPATDHRQVTRPMMRSAAQQGDVIAVTGPLGNSAGGLKLLMSNRSVQDSATTMLMDAHRRPEPMVRAGIWLAANGIRCAVDISDGLIDDLTRICIASGVGAKLQLSKLPVDPELKSIFPDKWRDMALGGGEGYQLAFTIPTNVLKEIQNSTEIPVIEIGQIIAGDPKVILLDSAGTEVTLCSTGFEHFTS